MVKKGCKSSQGCWQICKELERLNGRNHLFLLLLRLHLQNKIDLGLSLVLEIGLSEQPQKIVKMMRGGQILAYHLYQRPRRY